MYRKREITPARSISEARERGLGPQTKERQNGLGETECQVVVLQTVQILLVEDIVWESHSCLSWGAFGHNDVDHKRNRQ